DTAGSEAVFVKAVRRNVAFHAARCPEYAEILRRREFGIAGLRSAGDLHTIPPLPTAFLKEHTLCSKPFDRMLFRSTTSGTGGRVSRVGLDWPTMLRGLGMSLGSFFANRLFSPRPVVYIMLGYQPAKRNKTGIVKTAHASTFFAPALRRVYALKDNGVSYDLDMDGVKEALLSCARRGTPVRLVGFPAYFLFLLNELKESGVRLQLHPKSMVLLGGGWKQFFAERVDKFELYALSAEVLGVGESRVREFFGVVEHPVVYVDCAKHRFHVPVYSRVLIRDPDLSPVGFHTPGILNLITPIMTAMPHTSLMTDDLAVLYPGEECGCGIRSPYFEILGRVGAAGVKTCAAGAAELLK
ncbi:MAG: acyl-protein synthetase, partial [Clostridiales bacterium]|nr:acyl-protein synthetase [Clostridiales bacterium]